MLSAREVVYAFRQQYDRYDGKRSPSLDIRSQCYHINQAITVFIENTIKYTEIDSIHRENIRVLEIKEKSLSKFFEGDGYYVFSYPENHFKTLRRTVYASRSGCGNKRFPPILSQTDDLSIMLDNIYWKPNFGWEQAICDEGEKGLYVWTDKDFEITDLKVDYYRNHIVFDCPSLADNGKYLRGGDTYVVTDDTQLELPDRCLNKIIQIAVLLAQTNQGDEREMQARIKLITTLD